MSDLIRQNQRDLGMFGESDEVPGPGTTPTQPIVPPLLAAAGAAIEAALAGDAQAYLESFTQEGGQ